MSEPATKKAKTTLQLQGAMTAIVTPFTADGAVDWEKLIACVNYQIDEGGCVRVCVSVCLNVCVRACMCARACACVRVVVCVHACMHACVRARACVRAHAFTCVRACVLCMCVLYMYVFTK